MTELLLVRGLPGSGKSTLAKQMLDFVHIEADMFFVGSDGVYRFDADKVGEAHNWCQAMARELLAKGGNVVVSNTFTRAWEMKPYAEMGVPFRVVTCNGRFGNCHGVPAEVIERMADRWEPSELIDYI